MDSNATTASTVSTMAVILTLITQKSVWTVQCLVPQLAM